MEKTFRSSLQDCSSRMPKIGGNHMYCLYFMRFIFFIFLIIAIDASPLFAQTVLTTIPVASESGNGLQPGAGDVNTLTNLVYIPNHGSRNISVIDGATNRVIETLDIPAGRIRVNPETNRIYATLLTNIDDFTKAIVSVIDGATNEVINVITLSTLDEVNITDIEVNPSTNRIYISHNLIKPANGEGSGNITIIDGESDQVINTIRVGDRFNEIAVNPETNLVYITDELGKVSVIDGSNDRVIDTFRTLVAQLT